MRIPRSLLYVVSPLVVVGAVAVRYVVRRRRRAAAAPTVPPPGISDLDPEPVTTVVEKNIP